MDQEIITEIRRALRRSRIRMAILLGLLRLGEAYAADLARAGNIDPRWLHGALYGNEKSFRIEDALITMGLVTFRATPRGPFYSLTTLGAIVARHLQAELVRELTAQPKART